MTHPDFRAPARDSPRSRRPRPPSPSSGCLGRLQRRRWQFAAKIGGQGRRGQCQVGRSGSTGPWDPCEVRGVPSSATIMSAAMPTPIRTTGHRGPILTAAVVLEVNCRPEQTHQEEDVILAAVSGGMPFAASLLLADTARRQHFARSRAGSRQGAGARRRAWPGCRSAGR